MSAPSLRVRHTVSENQKQTSNHLTMSNAPRTINPASAAGQQSHRNTNLNPQSRKTFLMPRFLSRPTLFVFATALLFLAAFAVRSVSKPPVPIHEPSHASADPAVAAP